MSSMWNRLSANKSYKRMMALMVGSSLALASVPALAVTYGAVKVECWGDCSSVNLGQICDTFSTGSIPIAVACDDTATPGAGSSLPCGNGDTCIPYGVVVRGDLLSAYCADGGGNDAIVNCASNP